MIIRNYNPEFDYPGVEALYRDSGTFGGQFDAARDTKEKLAELETEKPGSILVAELNGQIIGTVTLFEDGRAAWLYRFAVSTTIPETSQSKIVTALWSAAKIEMQNRGHIQVLVYAPIDHIELEKRYVDIGFTKGKNYTAYWQDL